MLLMPPHLIDYLPSEKLRYDNVRVILGVVYHDLYFGGKTLMEMENMGLTVEGDVFEQDRRTLVVKIGFVPPLEWEYEKKMKFVEQPTGPVPDPKTADPNTIDKYYETVNLEQVVACLMLSRGRSISKLLSLEDEELLGHFGTLKIPPSPKRDYPTKDSVRHHYKEVGHWRRNCPSYQAELKKRKNPSVASTSSIFTIELYAFPNKTWVYDTGYGTHICNTSQGLRGSGKLKHRALSLYMGNGMRAVVEAIGSFDLVLPSGLIIVLDNCHFAPTITRGVVSISRLVNNGYIHTFTNYGISVSKDNVFYFNAIPHDGIYEIDMHNLYRNVSSMFNVSNKRAKHALDSSYLWHCRLGHINKKHMDKLHRDRILQPTHDESLEKCKSCISRKMACKPFPHQVERAKDL
ncbi:zinc finger, CCHC-type containing protein [Tanacetum coccineum]